MFRTAKLLTSLLVLLALGQSQVFGWVQAYLCPCGPEGRTVTVADCEGVVCHPHQDHADGCDATSDSDHSHRHLELRDADNQATSSFSAERVEPPASVVIWIGMPRVEPDPSLRQTTTGLPNESPPTVLLVAHSTVLLV